MDLMRSWVGIEEGKEERSAYCVMMNVRVLVVLSECPVHRNDFMCKSQQLLGDRFEFFRA